ncbi:Cysteine synthase 2 [Metarhizium acridum]|nr:Cysteine synthase 2 [Metarhizium acridum]
MSLSDHPRAYGSAAVALAFGAGILVTLGFKDLYPDLEYRYQHTRRPSQARPGDRRRSSLFWGQPLKLEDHESQPPSPSRGEPGAGAGIAACIGNTPLIEIESLSKATGRVILAKAEFLNGAGNSPKDRVALNMIQEAEKAGLLVPQPRRHHLRGHSWQHGHLAGHAGPREGLQGTHMHGPTTRPSRSPICFTTRCQLSSASPSHPSPARPLCHLARRRADAHTANSTDGSRGFFANQFESRGQLALAPQHHGARNLETRQAATSTRLLPGAGTGGTVAGVARYLKLGAKQAPSKSCWRTPRAAACSTR